MEKEMDKGKNIIYMVNKNLKENIKMELDGAEKDMTLIIKFYMN